MSVKPTIHGLNYQNITNFSFRYHAKVQVEHILADWYVCTHAQAHTHTNIITYTHTHTHIYIYIYTIYIYIYIYIQCIQYSVCWTCIIDIYIYKPKQLHRAPLFLAKNVHKMQKMSWYRKHVKTIYDKKCLFSAEHSGASLVEGGDWKGIAGVLVHIRAGISLVPMGSPVSPVDPVVRSRVKRPGNQVGYKTAMAELKHQPDNHLKDSIQNPKTLIMGCNRDCKCYSTFWGFISAYSLTWKEYILWLQMAQNSSQHSSPMFPLGSALEPLGPSFSLRPQHG